MQNYLNRAIKRSNIKFEDTNEYVLENNERVITLITCFDSKRIVVHATGNLNAR